LVHISEVSWKRFGNFGGVLNEGDKVKVKLIGTDPKSGKFKSIQKVLIPSLSKTKGTTGHRHKASIKK
jgi:polyribonucleotide nucleotidyltransferase